MIDGTSTGGPMRSTGNDPENLPEDADPLFTLPDPVTSGWSRIGLSPRGERALDVVGRLVVVLLAAGWVWSFSHPGSAAARDIDEDSPIASAVTAAMTHTTAVSTAYLTDAALNTLANRVIASERGASGKLLAAFQPSPAALVPDTLPPGAALRYTQGDTAKSVAKPTGAGIWRVVLAIGNVLRPVADFSVVTMLPFSAKQGGRIGGYYIGNWPAEHGARGPSKAPPDRYDNPSGFIEVTAENRDTPVSQHFRLGDFLTHDQPNVWPKYLVLQTRLIDKLELVLADLEQHGVSTRGVRVMSGFRTPQYNETGGDPAGRADLSRHMFGDAADIYIDNDGDGVMDDLNHDGRVDINDSRVILDAEDRVERAHPELVGGGGLYHAAAGHGPFIHIDARGYRARW